MEPISGFEEYAVKLKPDDEDIARHLAAHLQSAHFGKDRAINTIPLADELQLKTDCKRIHVYICRLTNWLRGHHYPICATSRGYFWAATKEELEAQIESLDDRLGAIGYARDGLAAARDLHFGPKGQQSLF